MPENLCKPAQRRRFYGKFSFFGCNTVTKAFHFPFFRLRDRIQDRHPGKPGVQDGIRDRRQGKPGGREGGRNRHPEGPRVREGGQDSTRAGSGQGFRGSWRVGTIISIL